MPKFTLLSDVVNNGGEISKEHGILIPRGTVLELDPKKDSVKFLDQSGVLQPEKDPGNSILDNNAANAIKLINEGEHSREQLEELKDYEQQHGNRKSVIDAIEKKIAGLEPKDDPAGQAANTGADDKTAE